MNYIIEGDINFNQKLMESICEVQTNENSKNCLISGMPLNEHFITLRCGHHFNYNSIFNEVKKQKKEINYLETTKLTQNQIKCPYCRNIQEGLLPFCHEKVRGVNWPPKYSYSTKHCGYIIRYGLKKGTQCHKFCFAERCYKHFGKKNIQYCTAILKTGKNKGQKCKCKSFKDGFCKRHSKKEIVKKT